MNQKHQKNLKNKKQKGFSLLELLVAVTLIVGLAALALPNYSAYQLKVKAAEFMLVLGPYKSSLQEWANVSEQSSWPSSNNQMNWPEASGKYVRAVNYERGSDLSQAHIIVSGFLDADETIPAELILVATLTDLAIIQWTCLALGENSKYFPASCQATSP